MTVLCQETVGVHVPVLEPGATCDAAASGSETAVVRVANPFGDVIDFCAHHFAVHEAALFAGSFDLVHDNRAVLTQGQAGER